jgi:hypothetical protein
MQSDRNSKVYNTIFPGQLQSDKNAATAAAAAAAADAAAAAAAATAATEDC